MGLLSAGVVHVGCRSVVFVVLYCEHQNWMMIALYLRGAANYGGW